MQSLQPGLWSQKIDPSSLVQGAENSAGHSWLWVSYLERSLPAKSWETVPPFGALFSGYPSVLGGLERRLGLRGLVLPAPTPHPTLPGSQASYRMKHNSLQKQGNDPV